MNFCTNCDNILFIKLSDDNQNNLVNYCRNWETKTQHPAKIYASKIILKKTILSMKTTLMNILN